MSKLSGNKKPQFVGPTQVVPAPSATPAASQPKVAKAKSNAHTSWLMQCKTTLDNNAAITVGPATAKFNKPTRKALFDLHRNGQTVGQYLEALVKAGQTKANATKHLQWDISKGFVTIA
jgi:hypothetical protein